MKLKSLLIGSAALMAAATGAKAADPIVIPEPEAMEYVRICDVYGAGFFYIPGTETCLKIGGYVRYQMDWSEGDDDSGALLGGTIGGGTFSDDSGGWRKLARANVTIDARSETEYGTLGGFIELRADAYSGVSRLGLPADYAPFSLNGLTRGAYLNQAYITLGGFFIGYKTTVWDQGLSGEYDKGGFDSAVHSVGYTFVPGNGVSVSLALEEHDYNYDYTPNVVAKVGLSQGWGSLAGFVAYDATAEEWAAKAFASVKATQQLTLELLATYASDANVYSVGYDYSLGGHLKYAASPKLSIGFGGQYFGDKHGSSADDWALGGVIDYALVPNLNTKLAINYVDGDSYADGSFSGFLRIDRSF
ncbi:porin [Nitratireductor soli]|uniref:porin n=1 Tax=Nitratireductor soli TaxID=1670619 RepID=UPI00065E9A24|nr:porin [Nitratireductor soli]